MEKDAFYFPHFSNARTDRKIRRVRKELGIEGYGIYFMILEVLRDQKDFKYPLDDIDLLADEFGSSEQKVRTVICNYDLFQNDEEKFFSVKFNEYLKPYLDQKARKRLLGIKGNLIKYKYATKEEIEEMTDSQVIELSEEVKCLAKRSLSETLATAKRSLRKESKVKEKKVNKSKYRPETDLSFFSDYDFQESWIEWREVCKRKKTSNSDIAIKRAINKLKELSHGNKQKAIKILQNSSDGGWTKLYPLKENQTYKPKSSLPELTDEEFINQYGEDVWQQLRGNKNG